MRLYPLLFTSVLCLALTTFASAGSMSPALEKALTETGEAAVIVSFYDRVDLGILEEDGASKERKLRALQSNADKSQAGFRAPFGAKLAGGRRYWLVNAAAFRADAATIRTMAGHIAVRRIALDGSVELHAGIELASSPAKAKWTYGLEKIRIPEVREDFGLLGDGVRVGHIDTGVDPNHPDLKGKIVAWKDCVNKRPNPYDDQGHGTHTAGTIAGGNAGGTHIGVAPGAKLVVAKVFPKSGGASTSVLLVAMEWMTDPDGDPATDDAPSLVSNSWGGGDDEEIFGEIVRRWVSLGIFPAFSAGNSGPGAKTVAVPAGLACAFAVGATDSSDRIARFSSRGPFVSAGVSRIKPDICGPGVRTYSAKPGGGYKSLDGTSMSCPHIAGVIALMHQAKPGAPIALVRKILEETAKDLGGAGKDNIFGWGRVDTYEAIKRLKAYGMIEGRLIDGATGAPVAGRVTISPRGEAPSSFLFSDPNTGVFRAAVIAGTYAISAKAFGYETGSVEVTVAEGQTVKMDLPMAALPKGTIVGAVKDAASGVAVEALIRVDGAPLDAFPSAQGAFRLDLPAGSYRLVLSAVGYRKFVSESIEVVAGKELPFEAAMMPAPAILVVDDDGGKNYETFFHTTLDALGKDYDRFNLKGVSLQLEDIVGYRTVIWLTGNERSETLTKQDREAVTAFVASGGRIILTGQNLAYSIASTPFLEKVLKARYYKDDSGAKEVKGSGLEFSIVGGDGAGNQKSPDRLNTRGNESEIVFNYQGWWSKGVAAIKTEKTLLMGFGLEGVATAADRKKVMAKLLELMTPGRVEVVARIGLLPRASWRSRWVQLVRPEIAALTAAELVGLEKRFQGSGPAVRDLIRALRSR